MHLVRLTVALIAASTLTACSSDSLTSPTRRAADPSLSVSSCRAAYIASSGLCTEGSTTTTTTTTSTKTSTKTSTTTTTETETCRAAYIASSGRCE